jgi:phospholipid-transporting ATPase
VIDPISISRGRPVILFPLLFVVILSAIKDIIEDRKRKKSDEQENNAITLVADRQSQRFEKEKW